MTQTKMSSFNVAMFFEGRGALYQFFVALVLVAPLTGLASAQTKDEEVPPAASDTRKPDPAPVVPANGLVPEFLVQLSPGEAGSPYAFVMDKAQKTLSLWKTADNGLVSFLAAYPADSGRNAGDKSLSGDYRTPEGIYFFQQQKDRAELDFEQYGVHDVRAFTLDYPNLFDVLDKKTGSGIWLHSLPDHLSLWRGSRGCVVVRNQVINDLGQYITLKKTPLLIAESVKYIQKDESTKRRQEWLAWLERWRDSWQSKSIETYMENYAPEFKSLGMNKAEWQRHKQGLNERYSFIKVAVREPTVLVHQDKMVLRFVQDYQSDKNQDVGEKTLYLRRSADKGPQIIAEEWTPLKAQGVVANH